MPHGDAPDPTDALEALEPEVVEVPPGIPVVKPEFFPDPPGSHNSSSNSGMMPDDLY